MNSFLVHNLAYMNLSTFLWLFISQSYLKGNGVFSHIFLGLAVFTALAPAVLFFILPACRDFYREKLRLSLFIIFGAVFLSTTFYLVQSDLLLGKLIIDARYEESHGTLETIKKVLQVSFILLAACAGIFTVIFQVSLNALTADLKRTSYMLTAAINITLLLVCLILVNYAARVRPASIDTSTIRKFSLSNEGRAIIKGIDRKVEITAFYAYFGELHKEVELMLADIAQTNPRISYTIVDAIRQKEIADKKKVSSNKVVLFESINENELEINKRHQSRRVSVVNNNDLKKMERDFVSAILGVTQTRKKIYFSAGHGEYSYTGPFVEKLISILHDNLRQQAYEIKYLNPAAGFPPRVPGDADMVAIINPQRDFSKQEKQALETYFFGGGKILLAVEPDSNADFSELLDPFEIKLQKKIVVSEFPYSSKKNNSILFATNYGGHPIVSRFIEWPEQYRFSVWPGTGYFDTFKDRLATHKTYEKRFFVNSNFKSWHDKIRNGVQDGKREPYQAFKLAVAVSLPDRDPNKIEQKMKPDQGDKANRLRLVAFANASFMTNEFIGNGKNHEIANNSFQWLLEDERIMGKLPKKLNESKVKLTSTQDDFLLYFMAFIWPFTILISGFFYVRLRKKNLEHAKEQKTG